MDPHTLLGGVASPTTGSRDPDGNPGCEAVRGGRQDLWEESEGTWAWHLQGLSPHQPYQGHLAHLLGDHQGWGPGRGTPMTRGQTSHGRSGE